MNTYEVWANGLVILKVRAEGQKHAVHLALKRELCTRADLPYAVLVRDAEGYPRRSRTLKIALVLGIIVLGLFVALALLPACTVDAAGTDAATDARADHRIPEFGCGVEFCTYPEACDGIDSDLDGLVDEDGHGAPLARFCAAPCGQGVQACIGGAWAACAGTAPLAETGSLACDGLDNDCDLRIDEDTNRTGDVLILIDVSGSMGPFLVATEEALARVATARPGWRFAVASFPVLEGPEVVVESDFGDPLPALSIVASGEEPSYDALAQAATDDLAVSWRADVARYVVLITDEFGQSYSTPRRFEASTCALFHRGETVISYTLWPTQFDACGPALDLGAVDTLADALVDPCGAGL